MQLISRIMRSQATLFKNPVFIWMGPFSINCHIPKSSEDIFLLTTQYEHAECFLCEHDFATFIKLKYDDEVMLLTNVEDIIEYIEKQPKNNNNSVVKSAVVHMHNELTSGLTYYP